jgi:hypothetical protein
VRLTTDIEVAGLCRRAENDGGFATVLRRGDRERGSLLLVISSRGQHHACLERTLSLNGGYEWGQAGPQGTESGQKLAEFLEKRIRFDEDLWLVELDIADPERFIAETISSG